MMPDIEVLAWPEPVRRRPEMYIGPLDDPGVCNCFITEALCDTFDNIVSGTCSEVAITISRDSVTIANNGPGVSMRRDDHGTPLAETMMTALFACRHMKANETIGKDVCRNGIAVINALSSRCSVNNKINGQHWQQHYTQGVPDSAFTNLGETTKTGFTIQFTPDPVFIATPSYDIPAFCNWLTAVRFTGGQAVLTIHDQRSSQNTVCRLYDGKFSLQSVD